MLAEKKRKIRSLFYIWKYVNTNKKKKIDKNPAKDLVILYKGKNLIPLRSDFPFFF